jgi:hypothetical protein
MSPNIATHPRRRGSPCGTDRAATQSKIAPSAVSRIAHSQVAGAGGGKRWLASKYASASIPGQARRYAAERQAGCATRDRAFHHVSHLRLMKMANDRIHMNTQAGRRLRKATAVGGNAEIGSQPIHGEPRTSSADSISLVSLKVGRSLCSGDADFVDGWKLVVIRANEAANQFSARKVTET